MGVSKQYFVENFQFCLKGLKGSFPVKTQKPKKNVSVSAW